MERNLSVEGHMPSKEEMERKAASGPHFLNDVNAIVREFSSAHTYKTDADLENLVARNREAVDALGYTLVDASHLFNGINNGLLLLERWATVVHTARTSKQMIVLRRTSHNCGPLLLLQRLEHLRGMVSEWAPLAFAVVVRDDQMLVTRDQVGDVQSTDEKLLHMAKTEELCHLCQFFVRARVSTVLPCGHVLHSDCYAKHLEDSNTCPVCYANCGDVKPVELELTEELRKFQDRKMEKEHNMPTALFSQEISLLRELRSSDLCKKADTAAVGLAAAVEGVEATVEGVEAVATVDIADGDSPTRAEEAVTEAVTEALADQLTKQSLDSAPADAPADAPDNEEVLPKLSVVGPDTVHVELTRA